jgi:hypothetical protein
MKETDSEMHANAKKIQRLESDWLHEKHNLILKGEARGRLQMTKKCHEILLEYLQMNTLSYGANFYDKEIEFKKWVDIWQEEQSKNEELESLLGEDIDLDSEIRKLEQ